MIYLASNDLILIYIYHKLLIVMWGEFRGSCFRNIFWLLKRNCRNSLVLNWRFGSIRICIKCWNHWDVHVYPRCTFSKPWAGTNIDVKSLGTWLWSAKAICGFEMAWGMHFVHTIYVYLNHDEPSHLWRTNTLTMTNQPTLPYYVDIA